MLRSFARPSKKLLLACLLTAAAVSSLLGPDVSGWLRSATGFVITPFGDAGMYLATSLNRKVGTFGRRAVSSVEADRLAEENARLRRRLGAIEGELARQLRRQAAVDHLYGPIPYAQWRLIPARVVAADALDYGKVRLVNAGSRQGVAGGALVTSRQLITDRSKALPDGLAAVAELPRDQSDNTAEGEAGGRGGSASGGLPKNLDGNGAVPGGARAGERGRAFAGRLPKNLDEVAGAVLVGRITRTGAHTARLRLVSDRHFLINAMIRRVINPASPRTITLTGRDAQEVTLTERNNAPINVVAVGDGALGLTVTGVYALDNVQPGDVLVTSGADGLLPAEVRIGTVTEVTDDPERRELFVNLKVAAAADLAAVRDVYVVVPVTGPAGSTGARD